MFPLLLWDLGQPVTRPPSAFPLTSCGFSLCSCFLLLNLNSCLAPDLTCPCFVRTPLPSAFAPLRGSFLVFCSTQWHTQASPDLKKPLVKSYTTILFFQYWQTSSKTVLIFPPISTHIFSYRWLLPPALLVDPPEVSWPCASPLPPTNTAPPPYQYSPPTEPALPCPSTAPSPTNTAP